MLGLANEIIILDIGVSLGFNYMFLQDVSLHTCLLVALPLEFG